MASASPTLLWFRNDLRLDDNPAVFAALARGGPLLPVFVWAPTEEGQWTPGAASRWWLHQSLRSLAADLEKLGMRLILRRGESQETLLDLARLTGAGAVCWNRRYEPAVTARDSAIKKGLRAAGLEVESFNASLLFEPWEVQTRSGQPFQVFSPFWRACQEKQVAPPHSCPKNLPAPAKWPSTLRLDELSLEPTVDWAAGLRAAWQPGETGAQTRLKAFLAEGLEDYATGRDQPGSDGTSQLSPHLHFGEISPRRIWHQLHEAKSTEVFRREIGWREFAYHLLYHFPHTTTQPLRSEFAAFPWDDNAAALRAWQRGRTGYPIVDAGLRQLWHTGWMHNRVRMITASLLVKDLLLPWQEGARWFWDTLVDADLANNTLGWQWVAGCGADATPYFRIFNPMLQGEKFDPEGAYVRRWVPELADVPARWIHRPWEGKLHLGKTYPRPIIDHAAARQRALEAFADLKASGERGRNENHS